MKIAMVGQFPPHVGGVGVHIHLTRILRTLTVFMS